MITQIEKINHFLLFVLFSPLPPSPSEGNKEEEDE
jgi:hypothetical protein